MMSVQVKDEGKSESHFVMKWIEIEFFLWAKYGERDDIISGESPAHFLYGCLITRAFAAD